MGKISKKAFASFVKEHRLKQGLTQEALAARINVSSEVVSKWERGIRFPNFEILEDVADALGVTLQELYDGSKKPQNKPYINVSAIIIGILLTTAIAGGIFVTKSSRDSKGSAGTMSFDVEYGIYVCEEDEMKPYIYIEKDNLHISFSLYFSYLSTYKYQQKGDQIQFEDKVIYVMSGNRLKYEGKIYKLRTDEYNQGIQAILIKTDKAVFIYENKNNGQLIEIINSEEFPLINELHTGDVIEVDTEAIMESYPARTRISRLINRDDIKVDFDIESVTRSIVELGYEIIF